MENSGYRGCSVSLSAADRCCSVLARHGLDEKEEEEVGKKPSMNRKSQIRNGEERRRRAPLVFSVVNA